MCKSSTKKCIGPLAWAIFFTWVSVNFSLATQLHVLFLLCFWSHSHLHCLWDSTISNLAKPMLCQQVAVTSTIRQISKGKYPKHGQSCVRQQIYPKTARATVFINNNSPSIINNVKQMWKDIQICLIFVVVSSTKTETKVAGATTLSCLLHSDT